MARTNDDGWTYVTDYQEFDPTDPRGPNLRARTGGSSKASPYRDSSMLITGNHNDGIGYASGAAKRNQPRIIDGRQSAKYQNKTTEEVKELRAKQGIANTHDNMGSLAVKFREQAVTDKAAGKKTITEKSNMKILDLRADEERLEKAKGPEQIILQAKVRAAAEKKKRNAFSNAMAQQRAQHSGALAGTQSGFNGGGLRGPSSPGGGGKYRGRKPGQTGSAQYGYKDADDTWRESKGPVSDDWNRNWNENPRTGEDYGYLGIAESDFQSSLAYTQTIR